VPERVHVNKFEASQAISTSLGNLHNVYFIQLQFHEIPYRGH